MHSFKRLITAAVLTIFSVAMLLSAALAFLIVTPLGGKLLVHYFKRQFSAVGLMAIGHYQGSLHNGFVLQNVTIKGLSYLPDTVVRIQEAHVRMPLWDLARPDLKIFNARFFIPDSDPLVFTGEIYDGKIKGNLYGTSVDLKSAVRFVTNAQIRKTLQGFIAPVDLVIQGPLTSPQIRGTLATDSIRYNSLEVSNVHCRLNLMLFFGHKPLLVKGAVLFDSGKVNVRKTDLQLSASKLVFHGDAFNPTIDINMGAKVEDMDIHLGIKGPVSFPQLTVSSDPPMEPKEALQVLFSDNALSASTSPFNGITSSELAQNFLNYSLRDIGDDTFGVKTKLTSHLKLGVEMDQMPSQPGATNIYYSRKINGEMDINEHMSLNVSQEVLTQDNSPPSSYQNAQPQADTQVYLQYKKRF